LIKIEKNQSGFKETKVGWIPTEWDVRTFGEIAKRRKNRFDPPSNNTSYKCIELEHIDQGTGIILGHIDSREQASSKNRFFPGDVLFGKLRPYLRKYAKINFDGVCSSEIWVLMNTEISISEYVYLIIQSNKFIAFSNKTSGTKMPRAEWDLVSSVSFPLPPIPEQKKIAEILNTWDKAIELVGKQIDYKGQLKKGLMQQLLTGKLRFPGLGKPAEEGEIPEGWRTEKLSDHFELIKRKNTKGINRVLTASGEYGLIDQIEFFNKSVAGKDLSGYYLLKQGEFAYNRSAMNGYPYGAIKRLDRYEEGAVSTLYLCFSLKEEIKTNRDFYAYYFEAGCLNRQLKMITQVGGRAHGLLNVTNSDFMNVQLLIPGLEERNKIAKALITFDKEIDLLKAREVNLKKQKRGLRQKLLTGEVRVMV
jgi:type I restriction enzyme, S subunit